MSEIPQPTPDVKDQPPPVPNAGRPVWELVIDDMRARDMTGRLRYGTPLQADNGRDALVDAYQELLDLCVYLRQHITEDWRARALAAEAERDKLQAFKDWCHAYLDNLGVPHHPPGSHGAEGCRIGDRMDWWRDKMRAAEAERDRLRVAARRVLSSAVAELPQVWKMPELLAALEELKAALEG